jgi:hypothetical protein
MNNNALKLISSYYLFPRNQEMWVHSVQMKQVADLFAQSTSKKEATAVFSCARLEVNISLPHTGQLKGFPLTVAFSGSLFRAMIGILD